MQKKDWPLKRLIGEQLSAVTFVMDYLQLDFDGHKVSLYVWPSIEIEGEDPRFERASGYRDALCAFIGQTVTSVEESPAAGLVVHFDLGAIRVRPTESDLTGPEIASYSAPPLDPTRMIWRTDDPPFDKPLSP